MIMKKLLIIIGISLITGIVVSMLLNKSQKIKNSDVKYFKKNSDDTSQNNSVSIINQSNNYRKCDKLNDTMSSSITAMSDRHKEASKIMKDSVEIICKRSEVLENENCELDQISDELDKLLREI